MSTPRCAGTALVLACLAAPAASPAAVQLPANFQDELVVGGLDRPTGFALLPDGRVLVIEQFTGRVRLFAGPSLSATLLTVPSLNASGNERGLLAIAVDPAWPARPYLYLYWTRTGNVLRLARYTATGELTNGASVALGLGTPLVLLDDLPDGAFNHNGGSIRFGPDGMLYLSAGEDAIRCTAQDSTSLRGAVFRLAVAHLGPGGGGPVSKATLTPPDNPLATTNANAKLVFAYGLRNPFRFHIDPATGLLYVADVGEVTWEEMNEVRAGDNLGWPHREGHAVIAAAGCPEPGGSGARAYTPPIHVLANTGSAIMSAGVYRPAPGGEANWPAAYHGSVFYSEYFSGILRRLVRAGGSWALAPPVPGQPSTSDWGRGFTSAVEFQIGPHGHLWWLSQFTSGQSGPSGALRRSRYVGPTTGAPPAVAAPATLIAAPNPFRGATEIAFASAADGHTRLAILDLAGREVVTLHDGEARGAMRVRWDGRDARGRAVPPGVYLARLERAGTVETARVLRLR